GIDTAMPTPRFSGCVNLLFALAVSSRPAIDVRNGGLIISNAHELQQELYKYLSTCPTGTWR
ncbi:hypothetical protein, partial [Comamonas testosteroni]|uniref:hypothetical protein n=1 Tax=Comamonas testosteroni TaxID=285 RepID=UPI0005B43C55